MTNPRYLMRRSDCVSTLHYFPADIRADGGVRRVPRPRVPARAALHPGAEQRRRGPGRGERGDRLRDLQQQHGGRRGGHQDSGRNQPCVHELTDE